MPLDPSTELRTVSATERSAHPRLEIKFEARNHGSGGLVMIHRGTAVPTLSVAGHSGLTLPQFYFTSEQRIPDERRESLTGYIDLQRGILDRIEEMRDEFGKDNDLNLELDFNLYASRDSRDQPETMSASATMSISSHEWEDVLEDLGYHERRLLELEIPPGAVGDVFETAVGHISRAERAHDEGRYDDALGDVRKALLAVQSIQEKEEYRQQITDEKLSRIDDFMEKFGSSIGGLKRVTDMGEHPEEQVTDFEGVVLRRDSDFVLTVSKAYLSYMADVLEEEVNWQ